MSQESTTPDLVELTRRMLDAASNRDFDAMLSLYAADAEWDGSRAVVQLHGHLAGSRERVRERYALTVVWAADLIVRVIVDKEIDEARAAAERLAEERG